MHFGVFLGSNNGRVVTHFCLSFQQKKKLLFGCAVLGPSCRMREILDTRPHQQTNKNDKCIAHFLVLCDFSSCFFFLNFLGFSFRFCCFLFVVCFFWQGFLRATSLGPTPSSIVCVVCFSSLSFFSLWFLSDYLFLMEKPCFPSPQTKGITGLPFFHFLFLCLSALLIFFPSFLLVFLVLFLFVTCFFSLFFPFSFFSPFVSWNKQHQNVRFDIFSSSLLSRFAWFRPFFKHNQKTNKNKKKIRNHVKKIKQKKKARGQQQTQWQQKGQYIFWHFW